MFEDRGGIGFAFLKDEPLNFIDPQFSYQLIIVAAAKIGCSRTIFHGCHGALTSIENLNTFESCESHNSNNLNSV